MNSEKLYPDMPPTNPPAYEGPPPPQPTTTTNVTYISPAATVMIPVATVNLMGSQPSSLVCKSCNAQIITRTEAKPTTKTHLFALLLCVLGLWCCVCVPYCMDSCQSIDHYCPNCNAYIGSSRS
ncbi:hypothetical protein ACJJTC_007782 [Scirpophaga incertulas]